MPLCECGCGENAREGKRFLKYHHLKLRVKRPKNALSLPLTEQVENPILSPSSDFKMTLTDSSLKPAEPTWQGPPAETTSPSPPVLDGPPPHPLPIDHRVWRLAVERPNTNLYDPWIKSMCTMCHQTMWTRDEKGDVCEECMSVAREEIAQLWQMRAKSHKPGGFVPTW